MAAGITAEINARLGIEARYRDQAGRRCEAPGKTISALWSVLAPSGVDASDPAALQAALLKREAEAGLSPITVIRLKENSSPHVLLRLPVAAGTVTWELVEEGGTTHRGQSAASDLLQADPDDTRDPGHETRLLGLPTLPVGYHRLSASWPGRAAPAQGTLAIVPQRAYLPSCVRGGARAWGLAAQLYALRSERNWGIGDFTDLAALAEQATRAGADAVGVNPLHALFPDDAERASPYSPSSRLFLNPLYLDVEAIEDFAESREARALYDEPGFRRTLADARAAPLVQYGTVADLKRRVLGLLYRSFRDRHLSNPADPRALNFRAFQEARGPSLRGFASFHALRERRAASDPAQASWHRWPAEYRSPASAAVAEFTTTHLLEVEFFEYLQWQTDLQLGRTAADTRHAGAGIGLYCDLAVGFDADGADAWMQQDVFVGGWSVGAPPDNWNPAGQSWGLLPPNPMRLRDQAYAPLIEMLRANMRHAGALRIDHILGLRRLFWVPAGESPAAGAYVNYPWQDLMGLIALESHRNRCLVIGEDLGTVPPGFREALADYGILSYWLLYFARDRKGGFLPPRRWPKDILAAVTTHDLPTLTGYWAGADVDLKASLSIYPEPSQAEREREERETSRRQMLDALAAEDLPADADAAPIEPIHRFLARTPARLAMVQLEDMLGASEQVNLPGTTDSYPNWRRKLPRALEEIPGDPLVKQRLAAIDAERRARPGRGRANAGVLTVPRATYRLQLNKDFTFDDAAAVLPYLHQLGISHVYVSPILEAQPGSTHGYDTTSFERLNPDLGGADGFARFSAGLRAHGLRLLVDFVPNHMGVGKAQNQWWLNLLERGEDSPYAAVFDVDWHSPWPELAHRLLVPLLGGDYDGALQRGELQLRFDPGEKSYSVWYFDNRFPIRRADYEAAAACLSGTLGDAASALRALLDRQWYRLACWQEAAREINYRRFFDINQLAGIRMENPEVFDATHGLIGRLIADGHIHGLRLDHIDGLYDPTAYLRRLRNFVERERPESGEHFPIVVEKILGEEERLHADWPVDGTTGYEFASAVGGLFVDPAGAVPLTRTYEKFIGQRANFTHLLAETKGQIIDQIFGGELTSLVARLQKIAERRARPYTAEQLRAALREAAMGYAVYRTYVDEQGASAGDRQIVDAALADTSEVSSFVRDALTAAGGDDRDTLEFAMRFQQFTAPIMAKSFEDTAFYRYSRLLSLNEVGGDPRQFGVSPAAFHRRMRGNERHWPQNMLATATHDTKRGEDVRARLNVLSELAPEWTQHVARWADLNRGHRVLIDGQPAPGPADEYMLYQTLVGAWPAMPGQALSPDALDAFRGRLTDYMVKAMREAKQRTSWREPTLAYEEACGTFISRLLDAAASQAFLADFQAFHEAVAPLGALNGLGQVVLKLTVPGVPDIYRGCELWDLSLVDPDNRRPVDFARRQRLLEEANDGAASLTENWADGRIKLSLTAALLEARRHWPDLFARGDYRPLRVTGPAAKHVIAFARRYKQRTMIVAVGRLFARLPRRTGALCPDVSAWTDTNLAGIARVTAPLNDVLTGGSLSPLADGALALDRLFAKLPFAVLVADA
jgi:(1->4)-alpha-D-glucan 1-alpha-D-glucosylmutase